MKPLQLMYVMLGLTGLARGALWLHTDLSGTEHFGLLALLPKPLPALLWILPALLCLLSVRRERLRPWGAVSLATLSAAVGVSSLLAATFNELPAPLEGTTLSLSVSNLSFAFAALLLPRLVDKVTVMGAENVRG